MTTYLYNPHAQPASIATENTSTTVLQLSAYGYDTYGDVTSLEDALGNTATSNYNNLGWLSYVSDPLTHTTTYTDDNWGRVISTQEPDETVTHTWYDNDSNVIAASATSIPFPATSPPSTPATRSASPLWSRSARPAT